VELAGLVRDSHAGLRRLQARHPAHASMATTLAVMAVRRGTLVAAHCGDTRLYLIRGDDARQLSRDHSEAQRLLSQGLLSEQAFMHDPRKHILDSALGVPDEPVIQAIECAVDVGDWLVIASDGAWSRLAPSAMVDIGKASCSPEDFAAACRRHVEARRPDDNYTLVVATIAA
jgi:protein phosphatase